MEDKSVWRFAVPELVYGILSAVYLICLFRLNRQLARISDENAFEQLQFEDSRPLKFFAMFLVLTLAGVVLVLYRVHLLRGGGLDGRQVIVCVSLILVDLVVVVLLIVFIQNPILRLIGSVCAVGAIGYVALTRN